MALVTIFLFQGLSKVGNVVFKQRRGKTYVDPLPVYNRNRIPTQLQLDGRANFSKATAYAKKAIATPEVYAVYKKKAYGKKTAYQIAFKHATKSPEVMKIDTSRNTALLNSKIHIMVMDDVRVEEVRVSIVSADGVLIEEGKAYLPADSIYNWTYVATRKKEELEGCKVIVVAKDLSGNEGMMESSISVERKRKVKKEAKFVY